MSTPREIPDHAAFLRDLDTSGRFHRDNAVGRVFHPGAISYREGTAENSLHIVWERGRILAHVDRYSPIRYTREGAARYAFWRVAVHNVAGAVTDLMALPRGGQHSGDRCPTAGERIEVDDELLGEFLNDRSDEADAADVAIDRLRERLLPPTDENVQRLSFNLVDEVINLLDTPAEPWSVQLEIRVTGSLDEGRLRAAVDEALRRHPIARARRAATGRAWNRNYWETALDLDVDPLQVAECTDDAAVASARARLHSTPVSLSTSPPLRVRLVPQREGDLLMMTFNHAATDGVGGLRLLHSIARAYTGEADPLPKVDFAAARDLMGNNAAADSSMKLRRYLAVAERLRELIAPPARLARRGGRDAAGYGFHHVRLSAEETQRLVSFPHAGSVNDLLLAALHRTVAAWNARHRSHCRRITVLVPANLRQVDRQGELVGNFTLPARVSTTRRQRASPPATLAAVSAQTKRKRQDGMGTSLLELLSWSWLIPLPVKQALIGLLDQRFTDTAVLSDLGAIEPPSFGDDGGATVETWFSTPARMPLGLAVGAATVGGRLHLVFRYRHPQLGPEAAGQLAECYLAELRRLVGATSGSGSSPTDRPALR